jgi:1-acyl-sn-glycerol-3-phosphate acyltransferase
MASLRTALNGSLLVRATRVARSAVFVLVYLTYLVLFMGFIQRFILVPLAFGFPALTDRLLGSWSRSQSRVPLRLLRVIAGVQVFVDGAIGPENRLILMNHQSIIDIVIGLRASPGALTIIPTRRRYAWGIPGISMFVRLARFPLISQTRKSIRDDLMAMTEAAERCGRGEVSMLIFPEGHRTKDGSILPFMTRGIRLVMSRAPLPVYCIVADGMWQVRTLADTVFRVADSHVHVRIIGPFQPPADETEIPAFLEALRERMVETLSEIRSGTKPLPARPLL